MDSVEIIGVIGLGYVGLPVAVAFARNGFSVTGYDIDPRRISALKDGKDWTGEVEAADLRRNNLKLTYDPNDLVQATFYIVTVPTPIDINNRPDLTMLTKACALIGPRLTRGNVVVIESTVYPGATEEVCLPVLEQASDLTCGTDFGLGYSPERINPGDREHSFERIKKVIAANDLIVLDRVANAYGRVVRAGIHRAPSIKVAEAAKVIENTQHDVNIALMNEIARICHLVGIRTADVLEAASTKWNFLDFYPGLVGGHCIGVDPYYLTFKAEALGYNPQVILSGRRINNHMGTYIARQTIQRLAFKERAICHACVGVLGLTFKENVPDIRNSKTLDIIKGLMDYSISPIVHDPLADPDDVQFQHDIVISQLAEFSNLDALILAVPHTAYLKLDTEDLCEMISPGGVFMDVINFADPSRIRSDIRYWCL